jgi:hypothetical protein
MRICVRGNLEEKVIQKLAIFGGIGIERPAQHEKCCRHFESPVDFYDLTTRRKAVRRLGIVSCDIAGIRLPGIPDIGLA